jgi:cobalt-zinc-cadmium efflux system protein
MTGHGHGHVHGHGHLHGHGTATGRHRGRLTAVLGITLGVAAAEAVGGVAAGSLALLADAGHLLTDGTGIGLAVVAATVAARPATATRTFGWQRTEVLAALGNAVLLGGVAVWVLVEAARRFGAAERIDDRLMLAVAALGLLANAGCLLLLRPGQAESINVRGAYLEVLSDLVGSVAVVVAAVLIRLTGVTGIDTAASMLIALAILPRAWGLLREAVDVLLEATPRGVDLAHVREHIAEIPGVLDVHDLHAWTITSGVPVLSAHVVVADDALAGGGGPVLDRLGECLAGHFDVEHCTFQLEPAGHRAHERAHHD